MFVRCRKRCCRLLCADMAVCVVFLRDFVAHEFANVCELLDEAGSTLGSSGFTAFRNSD